MKHSEQLAYSRARVSLLGAEEHMAVVGAALDALPRALALLRECETTLAMWADVAPAVSLRADVRALLETLECSKPANVALTGPRDHAG